jgi:uncharacterized protein (TIGR02453 family)
MKKSTTRTKAGAATHFTPALFRFLEELAGNNDREWFTAQQARYEADLREPALSFIMDFTPRLAKISPHFRADPRRSGGSLFRIHRDVRFSRDKSPYKTYTGIQFRHEAGRDAHAPGFYLHLQPGSCFAGAGIWHPDGPTLLAIREAIVEDHEGWRKATTAKGFARAFERQGERLTRVPKGFDPSHPAADDLRWKDHIGVAALSDAEVTAPGFLDAFAARCQASVPYMSWLCKATGQPF